MLEREKEGQEREERFSAVVAMAGGSRERERGESEERKWDKLLYPLCSLAPAI